MSEVPAPSQNLTEEKEKKKQGHGWLSARWRDRCLAAFVWFVLIYLNTPLFERFPSPSFIQPLFDPEYKSYRIVAYLGFIALVMLWLRLRTFWFAVYFLLFPLVVPFLLIWFAATIVVRITGWHVLFLIVWSTVSAAARVVGPSGRAAALALGLLPTCYLVILIASNKYIVLAVLVALFLASIRVVWGTFQWILKPLQTLTWLIDRSFFYFNKTNDEKIFNFDPLADAGTDKEKTAKNIVENAKGLLKGLTWVRGNVITERSLL